MESMGLVLLGINPPASEGEAESGAGGNKTFRWTGEGEAVVSFVDPELGGAP